MNTNGRESYVIAKALYVAAEILRVQKDPPSSDIETMKFLLDRYFSSYKVVFKLESNIKKALSRGIPHENITSVSAVEQWLEKHPNDETVVDLFDNSDVR